MSGMPHLFLASWVPTGYRIKLSHRNLFHPEQCFFVASVKYKAFPVSGGLPSGNAIAMETRDF